MASKKKNGNSAPIREIKTAAEKVKGMGVLLEPGEMDKILNMVETKKKKK